jgi:glycine oxidase
MNIAIIGAGVIGLATAWRTAARGAEVTLIDPSPASGASNVAAGMLTPVSEAAYGEESLLALGIASRGRYPAFVAELEELTGLETGYRANGIIEVAFDADEVRRMQERLGVPTEALTGRECRRLEPMLAPGVRGGLLAPEDGSIDPRRLAPALLAAGEKHGVRLVRRRATGIIVEHGTATGVRLDDGGAVRADRVLLAAGPWSGDLEGVPDGVLPPVRPVKGQVVRLRTTVPFLTRSTRGLVKGSSIYLVPRADGGIVAGLRPGSPDNMPVMGPTALPGLILGTGHFRNGILLTPVSADILTEVLMDGTVPEVGRAFTPDRLETPR